MLETIASLNEFARDAGVFEVSEADQKKSLIKQETLCSPASLTLL